MVCLCGNNATGKTNTIEAIQLITTGKSFRNPKTSSLIQFGLNKAYVRSSIKGDGRQLDFSLEISERQKTFFQNNKKVSRNALYETLSSILFCPDDLSFIKNTASYRRSDLDIVGSMASRLYDNTLVEYTNIVTQRNQLLKQYPINIPLLESYDEIFARYIKVVTEYRQQLFIEISEYVREVYQFFCDHNEVLSLEYVSNFTDDELSITNIQDVLIQKRQTDIKAGFSTLGPHRDDLVFYVNSNNAREFCSQGQQRSIVLAWKIAQVLFFKAIKQQAPVLLLDDVMSELDEKRRSAVLSFIQNDIQTVISTTNIGYFSKDALKNMQVVRYG